MEAQPYFENGPDGRAYRSDPRVSTFTLRDVLTVGFRHQRLVKLSFVAMFALAFVFVLLRPVQYESQMKILVKRERVDPLVTPDESSQQPLLFGVSEEELNSEVELLKSRDLLTQVVEQTELHHRTWSGISRRLRALLGRPSGAGEAIPGEDERIAAAVRDMAEELKVQPLRRSNVIQVSYASPDPELSAKILEALADRYLDKHLAVHRPSGAFDFFDLETQRYAGQLALAQAQLDEQNRAAGVISVQAEREDALRRLGDLEAAQRATEAQAAETAARIEVLEKQLKSRQPIRGETRSSLGPGPAYDRLVAELAASGSKLAGLHARAQAQANGLSRLQERARQLEQMAIAQQTLVRTAKLAEQNYMIYARKREEARIGDALDAQRILNVAIAEAPMAPFEPSGPSRSLSLLLGALSAAVVSVLLAFAADYMDPSFRTPQEAQVFLGKPVLGAFVR